MNHLKNGLEMVGWAGLDWYMGLPEKSQKSFRKSPSSE